MKLSMSPRAQELHEQPRMFLAEAASAGLESSEIRTAEADVANFATSGVVMYRQGEDEIAVPS